MKRLDRAEIYQDLPDLDANLDFGWRARIEVRCASNVPASNDMTPQAFVEVGWTEYKNTSPQEQRVFRTNIVNTTNPIWNSTFLINNP
jgi:Ca2+-dependent lipid-binding protein